jgi:hypothetical protein
MMKESFDGAVTSVVQESLVPIHDVDNDDDGGRFDYDDNALPNPSDCFAAVSKQVYSARAVQDNQSLRLALQAEVGPRSKAVQPQQAERLVAAAAVDDPRPPVKTIAQLKAELAATRSTKKVAATVSSPPFAAAVTMLPVVSSAGATNANHRVSRNGLTPTERKQRQLAMDARTARYLQYASDDDDDPVEDVTKHHRRRTTTTTMAPLSPSPGTKRVVDIKHRVMVTAASLDSDDNMLSVYDEMGNTLNNPSHPSHETMVGMVRATVGMPPSPDLPASAKDKRRSRRTTSSVKRSSST